MDQAEKRRIVEALILSSAEPISAARLAEVIPYCKPAKAQELVEELNAEYIKHGRAFEICEIAGGYQLRSLPEFAPYLQQILKNRPLRLSRAALETLAIVAYQQPVTRAEVEDVRGVDCGAVLRGLLERRLVRMLGKKDEPGRPILYGTSSGFLEVFGLRSLKELPTLREFVELSEEHQLLVDQQPPSARGVAEEAVRSYLEDLEADPDAAAWAEDVARGETDGDAEDDEGELSEGDGETFGPGLSEAFEEDTSETPLTASDETDNGEDS